jgi:hypothetical protein
MTNTKTLATIAPAHVRPMLAEAAAEHAETLRASLLEAAGSAVRPVWLTVEWSRCGAQSRVEAPVPDVRARVAAIELLLREGLGRPPQAEEPRASRIPDSVEAIEKMSWNDMQALFATTYGGRELRHPGSWRREACAGETRRSLGCAAQHLAPRARGDTLKASTQRM